MQSGVATKPSKSITLNPSMSFKTEHVSSLFPKTEASEVHLNNFGGRSRIMSTPDPMHGARSRTFFPGKEDNSSSNRTVKKDLPKRNASLCENRSNANPPVAAPSSRSHPSPRSPTGTKPKPSFRAQGITVQFSGRGATDEARRNALRKLGLLLNLNMMPFDSSSTGSWQVKLMQVGGATESAAVIEMKLDIPRSSERDGDMQDPVTNPEKLRSHIMFYL